MKLKKYIISFCFIASIINCNNNLNNTENITGHTLTTAITTTTVTPTTDNKNNKKLSPFKKAIKATKRISTISLYSAITICATVNCAISICGLAFLFKKMHDINNSYISSGTMTLAKYALKIFSNIPDINKCIIPGIIFTLSVNTLSSSYMAYKFFKKTCKAIKK